MRCGTRFYWANIARERAALGLPDYLTEDSSEVAVPSSGSQEGVLSTQVLSISLTKGVEGWISKTEQRKR
jgi:hypothetical protein